jgi:hypothetical protein
MAPCGNCPHPGQIFQGKVHTGDEIPKFHLRPSDIPQGQYAAKIFLEFPLADMALSDQYLTMRCGLAPKRTIPRAGDSYAATLGAQR